MGYHTEFEGQFFLDKPLEENHNKYLTKFSGTRRVKRNSSVVDTFKDPLRTAVNLPTGRDGCYYVGATGFAGQDRDSSVIDYNTPPADQPGLWCQWIPNEDGSSIEWDGGEKFYDYIPWLQYIITNFLSPWGYTINGKVSWRGENASDKGTIVVKDNKITTVQKARSKL